MITAYVEMCFRTREIETSVKCELTGRLTASIPSSSDVHTVQDVATRATHVQDVITRATHVHTVQTELGR